LDIEAVHGAIIGVRERWVKQLRTLWSSVHCSVMFADICEPRENHSFHTTLVRLRLGSWRKSVSIAAPTGNRMLLAISSPS
jgi:hypothetical protein